MTEKVQPKVVTNAVFSRKQLLKSERYGRYRDLLWVLLDEEGLYSLDEVDERIRLFLAAPVE